MARPTRWGTPGAIVQYWSLHPLTPWAEYFRGMNVRTPDEAGEIILRPWAAELELPDDAVDLTFDSAAGLGPAPEALVDDDWSACQSWVETNRPPALLAPSAALPGTTNVVLYGPRVRSRYAVPPIDPTTDVPCDPAGLEAWRNGESSPMPPVVRTPAL